MILFLLSIYAPTILCICPYSYCIHKLEKHFLISLLGDNAGNYTAEKVKAQFKSIQFESFACKALEKHQNKIVMTVAIANTQIMQLLTETHF